MKVTTIVAIIAIAAGLIPDIADANLPFDRKVILGADALDRRVTVFDCNRTSDHAALAIDEARCEMAGKAEETFREVKIVYVPENYEHEVKGCDLTIIATGRYCGRWSISYPNIDVIDHFSIPRSQCLDLHAGRTITLEALPIRTTDDTGLFRPLRMRGTIGTNIVTHRIGTNDADGGCTGEKFKFHEHSYESENAKLVSNLTLYVSRVKIQGDQTTKDGRCDIAQRQCVYPGGIFAWNDGGCRARTAYEGGVFQSHDDFIRTPTMADRRNALGKCEPADGTPCNDDAVSFVGKPGCWARCTIFLHRNNNAGNHDSTINKCHVACAPVPAGAFTLRIAGKEETLRGCRTSAAATSSPHFFVVSNDRPTSFEKDPTALAALIEKSSHLAQRNQDRLDQLTDALRRELCIAKTKEARLAAEKAHLSPASATFVGKGQVALLRGELLLTASCERTLALRRNTDRCFHDLPISYRGKAAFRHAVYHHVVTSSLETPCDRLPPVYEIGGQYVDAAGAKYSKYSALTVSLPNRAEHVSVESDLFEDVGEFMTKHSEALAFDHEFVQRKGEITAASSTSFFRKIFGANPFTSLWATWQNIAPTIAIGIIIVAITVGCCICCCCFCCRFCTRCAQEQGEALADSATSGLRSYIGSTHPPPA